MYDDQIITIVLPCHNQHRIVQMCIDLLKKQTIQPDYILVVDDHSIEFNIKEDEVVKVFNLLERGRVYNRNTGIQKALDLNSDIIIFMDGDCIPENNLYIENYLKFTLEKPTMVFGMRKHIPRPKKLEDFNFNFKYESIEIVKYPSDLLTANLDKDKNFDCTDLRTVAGVTRRFNNIKEFDEKAFMITTGMATWSCNFLMNKSAALLLKSFMNDIYKVNGWFDYTRFGDSWGGEDNAFGLDALFAGVNILMTENAKILHFMHERSDQLNTHVKLNHTMMTRYKNLLLNLKK